METGKWKELKSILDTISEANNLKKELELSEVQKKFDAEKRKKQNKWNAVYFVKQSPLTKNTAAERELFHLKQRFEECRKTYASDVADDLKDLAFKIWELHHNIDRWNETEDKLTFMRLNEYHGTQIIKNYLKKHKYSLTYNNYLEDILKNKKWNDGEAYKIEYKTKENNAVDLNPREYQGEAEEGQPGMMSQRRLSGGIRHEFEPRRLATQDHISPINNATSTFPSAPVLTTGILALGGLIGFYFYRRFFANRASKNSKESDLESGIIAEN